MEIEAKHVRLALSLALVALILWLSWDYFTRVDEWYHHALLKQLGKWLGVSGGALGTIFWLMHQGFTLSQAGKKARKEEKLAATDAAGGAIRTDSGPKLEDSLKELREGR